MKQLSINSTRKSVGIFVLLMAIFTMIAIAASAQKTYTVAVTSPTAGTMMVKGQKYTLEFKVTNTGMMSIAAMDTVMVDVSINGTSAYMGGTILMMPIAMGGSQTFQIPNFTYTSFTANNDNSNLCITAAIPHNTNSGTSQNCKTVKLRLSAPTAIAGQTNADFVSVYPNPAGSFIKVKATQAVEGAIRLYDMRGKEVATVPVSSTEQTIETGNYPSGIYFYRLSDKQGVLLQSGKITVSH